MAIMQPTYLPWLGYFDLIDQVDCFVFLDSVQFDRRSWQQRNRIKGQDGVHWLTAPVLSKGKRDQLISDVHLDHETPFAAKHLNTITHLYSKAPFFGQYIPELSAVLSEPGDLLARLNVDLIHWLCAKMSIATKTVYSSNLDVEGRKVELLVGICQALGAGRYISPQGSRAYIDENNLFGPNGIELAYHSYSHPEYRQLHGAFVPYLSALDLLFNEGPDSLSIIRAGRE